MMHRIKVLIAKPGLDGHDRGAKIVARYLRDAGMEVIYTGLRQSPETIVNTAIQEDVSIIGLSILSGAHLQLCKKIMAVYMEKKIPPPPMFLGGIIPGADMPELARIGIQEVFPPGTPLEHIAGKVREIVGQ
ncbi:MAG: cobalamin B12-binding domain-containing protein [Chrysiogenales bacterium]|nr:cobalamin B12-binding domain-containing protein [Candidatus Aminicenantes bacterium]TFG80082.1 MAG: cobalamin B12-binding domain-containing protein [Chrysiogenales bacterium]